MRKESVSSGGPRLRTVVGTLVAAGLGLLGGIWLFGRPFDERAPVPAPTAPSSRPRQVARTRAPVPVLERSRAEPYADASSVALAPSASTAGSASSAMFESLPFLPGAIPSAASALSAASTAAAPALAAERTQPQKPVVRVLWQHRGLCSDDAATAEGSERARYLADFVGVPAPWSAKFFAYPGVPGGALEVLLRVVPGLAARVETFLGLGSEIPVIYLHKSPQALRQYACVNDATVAYYDGSIHLSVSVGDNFVSEITKSVEHEYVHHVLLSHDITRPIWFQEGAAMIFAKESWAQYRFVTQPIPLATMVDAFAHTSKPEQAEAFYMEAYGMVRLLQTLWKKSEPSSEADLVDALLDRQVTPDALFQTALHERSPESKLAPLDQLQAFIASGFGLGASSLPRSSPSSGSP